MSPDQTLQQSLKDYPPPPRSEAPVLLIQGCYYVIAGLWVVVGLSTLQAPTFPEVGFSRMWGLRVLGGVVALIGLVLVRASRRSRSVAGVSFLAIATASLVGIFEVVMLLNGQLPMTFLMDATMQFGFLVWWAVATVLGNLLLRRRRKPFDQSPSTV